MSHARKFPLRLLLYITVFAYLVGDLFIFHGPLRWRIDLGDPASPAAIAHAKSMGIVARVAGQPISRSQLERAVSEQLWLQGKSPASATPAEVASAREAALDELVDHELLRLQTRALEAQLKASDEEINERIRRLVGRFETKGALETAMKSQGIPNERNLRERLAARIRQEKFIDVRIAPAIRVSEEEAAKWFAENEKSLALPERIEARHIFIPTLTHPPEEAREKLAAALAELSEKKKDFPALAKEISLDPATQDNGGALGWMTRDRLPADFAAPVFAMKPNEPGLVRTKLGWHLVEVTARQDAVARSYEDAKPEIIAALESIKRRDAVAELKTSLRLAEAGNIEIFHDVLAN
jgi:parvulin-like peptidyl-prolyl isomerase